ncbi:hypothetical protein [Lysinibacillus sp. 54212]|uniref:hypothetical protein n=1 Tax=Lysinibacillus sp. 54212 TaxID=3119829 RepID=UPI002FC9B4D0
MKKLILMMAMALLFLGACNAELSITELKKVPKEIQDVETLYDTQYYAQLINGKEGEPSYLVLNTSGNVTVNVEVANNALKILIDEEPQEDAGVQTHLYKIQLDDRDFEFIKLYKNGQETHFDMSIGGAI